jgi:serine/threonine protein kinase
MALESGTRVGIYEVTGKLGEGGMGQVYRAHDTSLDRDVALKVLPESFLADPDRLARFQREAKVLASLNHPNIGHIYGLEAAGDGQALVLEIIEGPTLADRIAEGPLPVEEALSIAGQIADALESAHAQGIIHRDLKPANVKVRPDGTVKVLDFGLAKAVTTDPAGGDASDAPTLSITGATQMGMVVGTAAYMAPEQARGKVVDKRADIWAFGVVLYEMLTGKRAFVGEDTSLTLAAVMTATPEMEALPANLTASARNCLEHCLQKDPQKRIRDAGDVQLALAGTFETIVEQDVANDVSEPTAVPLWQQPVGIGLSIVAAMMIAGGAAWSIAEAPAALEGVTRLPLLLEPGARFSSTNRRVAGISPNGRYVAYSANEQLYLRAMDQMEAIPIRGTEGSSLDSGRSATFSPDNQWIGFFHDNQIKRVAVTGGAPVALSDAINPTGMSWSADDTIYFGQGPLGIFRVAGTGGTPETVVELEQGEAAGSPQLLPGGEWLLFTLRSAVTPLWDESQIVVQSLVTGERRTLVNGGTDGRYVATGHLVYARERTLFALAFDVENVEITPGPVPLVENVAQAVTNSVAMYSLSDNGTLVYVPADMLIGSRTGRNTPVSQLVWVDRSGDQVELETAPTPIMTMALSPDGRRIAYGDRTEEQDVWIYDLDLRTNQRLTFDPAIETTPMWTPDGERIAFFRLGIGVLLTNADGTGQPEMVWEFDNLFDYPATFFPDGSGLLVNIDEDDLGAISIGRDTEPETLLGTDFTETNLALSPDGNWLAYQSDESGANQVFVRPFPDVESGLWQVSRAGGQWPEWGPEGDELFYVSSNGEFIATRVQTDPTFSVGTEEGLFEADDFYFGPRDGYAVSPDGDRFLMLRTGGLSGDPEDIGPDRPQLNVVQDWYQELVQRVPVP